MLFKYNIIVQVRQTTIERKKLPILRNIQYGPLLFFLLIVLYLILTTISLEQHDIRLLIKFLTARLTVYITIHFFAFALGEMDVNTVKSFLFV